VKINSMLIASKIIAIKYANPFFVKYKNILTMMNTIPKINFNGNIILNYY